MSTKKSIPPPPGPEVSWEEQAAIVNPINPGLTDKQKLDELDRLTKENQPIVREFIHRLDEKFGTKSADDIKHRNSIRRKAKRQSITKQRPWFGIEHIRDAYRFKTVLNDVAVLPHIIKELKQAGFAIVKTDTAKLLAPGPWGGF